MDTLKYARVHKGSSPICATIFEDLDTEKVMRRNEHKFTPLKTRADISYRIKQLFGAGIINTIEYSLKYRTQRALRG